MDSDNLKIVSIHIKSAGLLLENALYTDSVTCSLSALLEFARSALGERRGGGASDENILNRFRLRVLGSEQTGEISVELQSVKKMGEKTCLNPLLVSEKEARRTRDSVLKIIEYVRQTEEKEKEEAAAAAARRMERSRVVKREEENEPERTRSSSGNSSAKEIEREQEEAVNLLTGLSERDLPPERLTLLQDLYTHFEGDKAAIGRYLKEYGWEPANAARVNLIRRNIAAERAAAQSESQDGESAGEDRSPYFAVEIGCPFCGQIFPAYQLKSKSLLIDYRYKNTNFPLLVEEAVQPRKGYTGDDPLRHAAHVCPACLYASLGFVSFKNESAFKEGKGLLSHLTPGKTRELSAKMKEDEAERRSLTSSFLGDGNGSGKEDLHRFFVGRREMKAALAALHLAARCARIESEFFPENIYQAAASLMAAAKIEASLGGESHEGAAREKSNLQRAMGFYQTAFSTVGPTAEGLYRAGVLAFHLGEIQEARRLLGTLVTDQGKFADAHKYKRWARTLLDQIRDEKAAQSD